MKYLTTMIYDQSRFSSVYAAKKAGALFYGPLIQVSEKQFLDKHKDYFRTMKQTGVGMGMNVDDIICGVDHHNVYWPWEDFVQYAIVNNCFPSNIHRQVRSYIAINPPQNGRLNDFTVRLSKYVHSEFSGFPSIVSRQIDDYCRFLDSQVKINRI